MEEQLHRGIGCPDPETLLALVSGREGDAVASARRHLEACDDCRTVVVALTRSDADGAVGDRPASTTFRVGQMVGRYEIRRFVACGGMGEVYEASDTMLDEVVALKTMTLASLDDRRAFGRFKAEVQLARRVTHPNVCRLLEFGIHDQSSPAGVVERIPFLTMEYLRGGTLRKYVAMTGPLPVDSIVTIANQIIDALIAIHAAGIVHRDLKSDNIFLCEPDQASVVPLVKVMDFGLARSPELGPIDRSQSGAIIGTAESMAPEQVRGLTATAKADVYALGVVLFEMLTGTLPFEGRTAIELAAQRLTAEPPRPSSRANIPECWDSLVLACLSPVPERRPELPLLRLQVARAVAEAKPKPAKRLTVVCASVGLVALAGGGLFAFSVLPQRPQTSGGTESAALPIPLAQDTPPREELAPAAVMSPPFVQGSSPRTGAAKTRRPRPVFPGNSVVVSPKTIEQKEMLLDANVPPHRPVASPSTEHPPEEESPQPESDKTRPAQERLLRPAFQNPRRLLHPFEISRDNRNP